MTSTSTAFHQATTRAHARRNGYHWTQAELNAVHEATRPLADVALELGRTLYAVTSARRVVNEGVVHAPARPQRQPLPFDRGFTNIEELFGD